MVTMSSTTRTQDTKPPALPPIDDLIGNTSVRGTKVAERSNLVGTVRYPSLNTSNIVLWRFA